MNIRDRRLILVFPLVFFLVLILCTAAQASYGTQPKSPVALQDGNMSNPSLKLNDKIFSFEKNPISQINGEFYLNTSDPDFKSFMDSLGLTYSWYSFSGKLFIYLPQGSISWTVAEPRATSGNKIINLPLPAYVNQGEVFLPVKSLAELLNLQVAQNGSIITVRPSISFSAEKSSEEDTIDILVNMAADIKYDVKYTANPPAVRFMIPKTGYRGESKKLFVEGVRIKVNEKLHPENLYVTMEFPTHWKGIVVPSARKNQIRVRMKPNLSYAWGDKNETIKDVKVTKSSTHYHMLFTLSNTIQYYWSYDREEGVLYIDVPFAAAASDIASELQTGGPVKNCRIFRYNPDGVSITRLRIELEPNSAFMIGPPENGKGCSFALLIGPKTLIADASPNNGSSSAYIAYDGSGSIGGMVVVLDPGHGGSDPGACNRGYGLKEKDITLDISNRIAQILSPKGIRVILTRYNDTDLTYPGSPDADELQARSDVANRSRADLFVSVHCNASASGKQKGSSYHWYKDIDRQAAEVFRESLGENIGTAEKGLSRDSFYVIRHAKCPAVLVETAFISHPDDVRILADPAGRQRIAEQIATSIDYFLHSQNFAKRPGPASAGAEE